MAKKTANKALTENDVTDEAAFINRRQITQRLASLGLLAQLPPAFGEKAGKAGIASARTNRALSTQETRTEFTTASQYNNFYEFSVKKDEPHKMAQNFVTRPWTLTVDGLVAKPQTFDLDDLLKSTELEERIYRFRCVEAWSMVIPWTGFPITQLLSLVEPKSEAKYVRFETLYDPEQFPGQNKTRFGFSLKWPYVEGLTLAEASHELAMLVVGMYGKPLPNQNGAPIRLIVPWKYGFKSIKSIVKMTLTDTQPKTSWNVAAPKEYGFYANVNPAVDHPRWSQKIERRITSNSLFSGTKRIKTQPFNGYLENVAGLYKHLDLKKHF